MLRLYGDFEACGYSRAAKTLAEEWLKTTPYCASSIRLEEIQVPLGELRAFKGGAAPSPTIRTMVEAIRKAKPSHDPLRTTLPAVFVNGVWVKEGYSGMDQVLKTTVCTLPSKTVSKRVGTKRVKPVSQTREFSKGKESKAKERRSKSRTRSRSTKTKKRSKSKSRRVKTKRRSRSKLVKTKRRSKK